MLEEYRELFRKRFPNDITFYLLISWSLISLLYKIIKNKKILPVWRSQYYPINKPTYKTEHRGRGGLNINEKSSAVYLTKNELMEEIMKYITYTS